MTLSRIVAAALAATFGVSLAAIAACLWKNGVTI